MRPIIDELFTTLNFVMITLTILAACAGCAAIRTDILQPAFQEETKLIKLIDQMADAYWEKRDLKAGLATGKASITPPSLETKQAIANLNSLANPASPDYQKGLGLGYWINYLWYDSADTLNRAIPPFLELLKRAGVL